MSINIPVQATEVVERTAEERQRQQALDWLRSLALGVVISAPEPLRTADVGREVAEQLGLILDEEESGALASLMRLVMDSEATFAHANRLWDLAVRAGRAEVDTRRPIERAMEDFINQLGHPATPTDVGTFIAAVYGRDPEYYAAMIRRMAPTHPRFFQVPGGRVAVTSWLLALTSDDPEEVVWDNFEDPALLAPALAAAEGNVGGDNPLAYARALLDAAPEPLPNAALTYVVWRRFPDVEPQALFNDLLISGEVSLLPGPCWQSRAHRERLLSTIRKMAAHPELAADLLATVLPAEEEEVVPVVQVTADDLDQVHDYMERYLERSFRVTELCQDVLEAFPGSRTFAAIRESLEARLRSDPRFVWVGGERLRLDGTLPSDIQTLPEGLAFDERVYTAEEGEEIDKILPPERWKFNLDQQILHPLMQDVGDDDLPPEAEPPAELRVSPPLHHYVAGTIYVPNACRRFFPFAPDLVELHLLTANSGRIEAWLNNRLGLVFGLKEWYDANLPWTGGLFHVLPTAQPDEYQLQYSGERELLLDIPMERLQELLILRGEAELEGLPLTEIVTRILRRYPEGLHFVTLFAQANVVRRIRRVTLASVLSAQRYFTQLLPEPGIWRFDERRAEKATRRKGPRRARAVEEEEEAWEEAE
ncbi:MAG: hypothetical protein HY320_00015 [Armatimonadetes bacterium]|nr:hypothetical protein [Armatimonadota bacterium]